MELTQSQRHAFLWLTPFPAYIYDDDKAIVSANPAFLALVGQEWSTVQGQPYWAVLGFSGPVADCLDQANQAELNRAEIPIGREGGVYALYCATLYGINEVVYGGHFLVDATQEANERERLRLIMGAMSLTNQASQALIYAESEANLLERFCTLMTNPAPFVIAWIALCDDADCAALTLQCHKGEVATTEIGQTLARDSADPAERAFLKAVMGHGQEVVAGSGQAGETETPWPQALLGFPVDGALALPILAQGQRVGILGVHVSGGSILDAEIIRLFKDLASDLGYGISFRRAQAAHEQSREELEAKLRYQARHDPLTGLVNRRPFEEALGRETQRAQRYGQTFALIMLDIDRFKAINDTYGHELGDRILKELSTLISERLRDADLLARWGGEEFMALLPETEEAGARELAEAIRHQVAEEDFPGVGQLTISLGVAEYRAYEAIKDVTKRVDDALYVAKEGGRNRVIGDGAGRKA